MNSSKAKTVIAVAAGVLLVAVVATLLLFRHKIEKQFVLHSGQAAISKREVTPINLTTNYSTPASYFDKITRFPAWKTVPRGFQVFDNIPLHIDGMMCLYGEGNATTFKTVFPEKFPDIAMNQQFETLYVYHCAFFGAPSGTPVCEIVFNYIDGSSATNQLLYGEDILDWLPDGRNSQIVGPTAARSKIAWVGGSASTNSVRPLRFCLTAIANPQPALRVTTVDLYSCKNRPAACILAMTAGKSGQMK